LDLETLALYCQEWATFERVQTELAAAGDDVTNPKTGQARPNPLLVESLRSQMRLLQLSKKLGVTPLSRARLAEARANRPRLKVHRGAGSAAE